MAIENNVMPWIQEENNLNVHKKKMHGSLNAQQLDVQDWRELFFYKIQNQKFIIFKDDFDWENLQSENLDKIKWFATVSLTEIIVFFNCAEKIQIYLDYYQVIKDLKLTGFKKNFNSTLQLFYIYKNSNANPQQKDQVIQITFDTLKETKSVFLNFINDKLKFKSLNLKDVSFKNTLDNINEWSKPKVHTFWKINFWIEAMREMMDDIFKEINQNFSTNLKMSDNWLVQGWKMEDALGKKLKIEFLYQRFDVGIFAYVEFFDFDQLYSEIFVITGIEKLVVKSLLGYEAPIGEKYDYFVKIDANLFTRFDYMQKYLHIYERLNNLCQRIKNNWNFLFNLKRLLTRIEIIHHNFDLQKIIVANIQPNHILNIKIIFSTIQKFTFERVFRIEW